MGMISTLLLFTEHVAQCLNHSKCSRYYVLEMVKEQRFRAESEVESAVPSVSLPETLSPLCPPGADVSRQPSSPEGLSPLGGGGRGGQCREHAQHESTHHLPSACPLPSCSDRLFVSGAAAACLITLIAVWFAFIKETAGIPN